MEYEFSLLYSQLDWLMKARVNSLLLAARTYTFNISAMSWGKRKEERIISALTPAVQYKHQTTQTHTTGIYSTDLAQQLEK